MLSSSSGLGYLVLIQETTGSNPVESAEETTHFLGGFLCFLVRLNPLAKPTGSLSSPLRADEKCPPQAGDPVESTEKNAEALAAH